MTAARLSERYARFVCGCMSMSQCVAVCCSLFWPMMWYICVSVYVLQCVAVCVSVLQCLLVYNLVYLCYRVASNSRLLTIIGLFCKIAR